MTTEAPTLSFAAQRALDALAAVDAATRETTLSALPLGDVATVLAAAARTMDRLVRVGSRLLREGAR